MRSTWNLGNLIGINMFHAMRVGVSGMIEEEAYCIKTEFRNKVS